MEKESCFHLGKITKTHGLKGEVQIWLDVDKPEAYAKLKSLYLEIKGELVSYDIQQIQIRGKKSILKLKVFNKIEEAEPIIGSEIYLPLEKLPKLNGKAFYYHDVIGYTLKNNGEAIAPIKAIYESTGQDLFACDIDEAEILIPIVDDFIVEIDHQNKSIDLSLPDGLLDIYKS
jgi:16S rRNA processing protein RimM